MNNFVKAIISIIQHFVRNFSDYALLSGLLLILGYVFKKYGTDVGFLSIGVLLLITSFTLEINKVTKGR